MNTPEAAQLRRWSYMLDHLCRRLQRAAATVAGPASDALGESIEICGALLQDVLSAEAEWRGLRVSLAEEQRDRARLFEVMPVPCLRTNADGIITSANRAAALVLNLGAAALVGRNVLHFIVDREQVSVGLQHSRNDHSTFRTSLKIKPREKAVRPIDATVVPEPGSAWTWFLLPTDYGREARETTVSRKPVRRAPREPSRSNDEMSVGGRGA